MSDLETGSTSRPIAAENPLSPPKFLGRLQSTFNKVRESPAIKLLNPIGVSEARPKSNRLRETIDLLNPFEKRNVTPNPNPRPNPSAMFKDTIDLINPFEKRIGTVEGKTEAHSGLKAPVTASSLRAEAAFKKMDDHMAVHETPEVIARRAKAMERVKASAKESVDSMPTKIAKSKTKQDLR
jgi:hypothetical protein